MRCGFASGCSITSVFTFLRPLNSDEDVLKSAFCFVISSISSSVPLIIPKATQAFLLSPGRVWSGMT